MPDDRVLNETDLFRAYWDDGLLDLLAGLALLLAGLGFASEVGALAAIQAPLWVVLWMPLRRRLVEPRAGFVRFSLARRRRNSRGLGWTLAVGVGMLAVAVAVFLVVRRQGAEPALRLLVPGLPAALVAVLAALTGLLTGARRFHAYALALLVAAAAGILLGSGPALPLVVGALIVVAVGVVLLTRFLRASRDFAEQT